MAPPKGASRRVHEAFVRRVYATERDLDRVVEELFRELEGLPPEDVMRVLREASADLAREVTDRMRRAVEDAARLGAESSAAALRVVAGGAAPEASAGAEAAARWVLRRREADGLVLSSRIHRQTALYRAQLDQALEQALREGTSAQELVRRWRDELGLQTEAVPTRAVQDLQRAVRQMGVGGGDGAVAAASQAAEDIRRHAARLLGGRQRIGHGMRPATEELLKRVETAIARGQTKVAEKAIGWWARDKQQYGAKVVARTEMQRAFSRGVEENARAAGFVEGLIWNTLRDSSVCEVCAARHGRVYRLDDLPDMPAHPLCRCYWTHAIDRRRALAHVVDRALAAA